MPIVNSEFLGNKFSRNAHVETALPGLFRKLNVVYQRERIVLYDGDFIDLDWNKVGEKKLLILFHGLEGSSQSQYIKGFVNKFSANQFDCCAVNFRSCSGEMNHSLGSYHSGVSADMHEVIQYILKQNCYTEIYLSGFSLGGNVLLKYLGENQFKIPTEIKAAAAFSVPIDLATSAKKLEDFSNYFYMQMFLSGLCKKIIIKDKLFPGKLNLEGLNRIRTFAEWDNRFTAPLHGFKDAADYYQKVSSKQFLKNIQVPTLLLNAHNDPFLSPECFPEEKDLSPQITYERVNYGGHCGFSFALPNGNYYSEQRALHFFLNNKAIMYV